MKKETKTLKLIYEFNCGLNGIDYEYRQYDGELFIYEKDIEDIKYDIIKSEIKKLELELNPYDVIDIFDDMLLWDDLIDIEEIKQEYKNDAMQWFRENHSVEED